MFSAYCKQCGTVILLGLTNIRSIHNTSNGFVVYFCCHAGHSGVWLPHGGRRAGRVAARVRLGAAQPRLHAQLAGPSSESDEAHSLEIAQPYRRPQGERRSRRQQQHVRILEQLRRLERHVSLRGARRTRRGSPPWRW
jgi:hypothetical protein